MTNNAIRAILSDSLAYPDGPKFWESENYPISSKIGEGHKFTIKSGVLTTTAEMIEADELRWEGYDPGDMTNAFETKEDIYKIIDFLKKNVFVEEEWQWEQ